MPTASRLRDTDLYPHSRVVLRRALRRARWESITPQPTLTLSQWAIKNGRLSRETSAQTGRFRPFNYQVGIMDAITDFLLEQITVMKSARVGFTKILDMAVGYYIHQDPSPQLVVQPRTEDAEDYSDSEFTPMMRDTPVLALIAGDTEARSNRQKVRKKSYRNGASAAFIGANAPGGFRRITVRCVYFDEVDGYPAKGAGKEGDQIALGIKRTLTFWNRRIVDGSTPTIQGYSRIEARFAAGDMRFYFVPCPHCGEFQVLEWGGRDTPYGFKWQKNTDGFGLPETVVYVCRAAGCVIQESDKADMVERGEWRATSHDRSGPTWASYLYERQKKKPPTPGHASFHIWSGYSLFPNASWPKLVAEWLEAFSNPLSKQTFFNTVLGLPYEDLGDKALREEKLAARTEVWPAPVPMGVAVVTCGIDVQDDRVEVEVVGWGRNEESWSLAHHIIEGDPGAQKLWDEVDEYLKKIWRRADLRGFEVMAACADSGGHHTQQVYDFCKKRIGRRIWAIKGESARGGKRSPVWPTKTPSKRRKQQYRPVIIGVNAAKDVIRHRLHLERPPLGEACAGYMHYPVDRDINYFAQLTSEKSVTKFTNGQRYRVWELPGGRANEALDCRVYAYAALCGLLHLGFKLNKRADEVAQQDNDLLPPPKPGETGGVVVDKPKTKEPSITVETPVDKPKTLGSKLPR